MVRVLFDWEVWEERQLMEIIEGKKMTKEQGDCWV